MSKFDIAAYVWPSYTGDELRTRIFWPQGYGEWETVKDAVARFPGHQWPRKPVWGYVNEADPYVMEAQIEAAVDHGVNVFIYDWYWYDGRQFLEQCLENGFLKAKNHNKMKFYLMWANHDVPYLWDRRIAAQHLPDLIWRGRVSVEDFHKIGKYWLENFFTLPEYYKIDGKPVIGIYDMWNLLLSFGSAEGVREQMNWLDEEAKKYGLPGVHFQLEISDEPHDDLKDGDKPVDKSKFREFSEKLPFSSVTHYQFCAFTFMGRDYKEICEDAYREWDKVTGEYGITYYPNVSVGWDNTPRYFNHTDNVVRGNTPEEVEKCFRRAKKFAEEKGIKLITVNSWNEWTETSYLEPDDLYGYGYLDAIKKVFVDEE